VVWSSLWEIFRRKSLPSQNKVRRGSKEKRVNHLDLLLKISRSGISQGGGAWTPKRSRVNQKGRGHVMSPQSRKNFGFNASLDSTGRYTRKEEWKGLGSNQLELSSARYQKYRLRVFVKSINKRSSMPTKRGQETLCKRGERRFFVSGRSRAILGNSA